MNGLRHGLRSVICAFAPDGLPVSTGFIKGEAFADAAPETAVLSITHVSLTNDRHLRSVFWSGLQRVNRAMPEQSGLFGYSLRRQLLGNEAWTFSLWRDSESLMQFVDGDVHRQVMADGADAFESARVARAEIPWLSVVPTWDEVLGILEARARFLRG